MINSDINSSKPVSYNANNAIETDDNNDVGNVQNLQNKNSLTANSIESATLDYPTDSMDRTQSDKDAIANFTGNQDLFSFYYNKGNTRISLQWNGYADKPNCMYYDSSNNKVITEANSMEDILAEMSPAILNAFKSYFDNAAAIKPPIPSLPDTTQPDDSSPPNPAGPTQPEVPNSSTPAGPTQPDESNSTTPEDPAQSDTTNPTTPDETTQPDTTNPTTPDETTQPDESTSPASGKSPVEPGPKEFTTQWGENRTVNYEDLNATGLNQMSNWGSVEGKKLQSWTESQYDKYGVPKNFWIDASPTAQNGFGDKVYEAMKLIDEQGNKITAKNGETINYTDMIDMMKEVGAHWNIPWELLLAMSVQESNIGTYTSNGAGCGILQVEKGTGAYDIFERPWLKEVLFDDPKVKTLLNQGGIDMNSRPEELSQVPDEIWDDPYLSMNMACAFLTRTLEQQEGTPTIGKGMDTMFNMASRYNNGVPSNAQPASGEKSLKGQTYASYVMAHLAYILQNKEAMEQGTLLKNDPSGTPTASAGGNQDTSTPSPIVPDNSIPPTNPVDNSTDTNYNPYNGAKPVAVETPDADTLQKIKDFTWEKNAADYRDPGSANDISKIVGQALDLPPDVLFGLIMAESWGSPTPGNADGLMQVQEPTWNETINLHKADLEKLGIANPNRTDPMHQVIVGALYLKDMIAAAEAKGWQGDEALWVGVGKYNAGPGWDPGKTAGQDIYGRQINADAHIQKVKAHAANYIDPDTGKEGY